jgi:hypothetical protein
MLDPLLSLLTNPNITYSSNSFASIQPNFLYNQLVEMMEEKIRPFCEVFQCAAVASLSAGVRLIFEHS